MTEIMDQIERERDDKIGNLPSPFDHPEYPGVEEPIIVKDDPVEVILPTNPIATILVSEPKLPPN